MKFTYEATEKTVTFSFENVGDCDETTKQLLAALMSAVIQASGRLTQKEVE